jgi:transposase
MRAARVSDDQAAEIVLLGVRGKSQTEIARRVGVHRATVARVLRRTHAARQLVVSTDEERGRAVALYREVQRTAWEAVETATERGKSPAMLLAEVRQA